MRNGHDKDWGDPKITSLDAARRKAEAARKATGSGIRQRGVGEWLVGALIVAMAVGFLLHLARPLWQGALQLAP